MQSYVRRREREMRQAYQLEWASKDLGQESRVALGDVNGDGNINIIAGTTASSGQQSNLHVFQYRGQSYHQLARTSLGNNDTHWIGCHDIDKDGIDEIIVGCTLAYMFIKCEVAS